MRVPSLRRGAATHVGWAVALLVAVAGTSYASTMITSAQIRDGTIENRDVAAGTLTGAKVHDGSLQLADLGASARTAAYAGHHDAVVEVSQTGLTPLMSLHVPAAGSYVVIAKTIVSDPNASSTWAEIDCYLDAGGDSDGGQAYLVPGSSGEETLAMQVAHTFTAPGNVTLGCSASSSTWLPSTLEAQDSKVTAIRVGSLTDAAR
jgi:hypothetical protein